MKKNILLIALLALSATAQHFTYQVANESFVPLIIRTDVKPLLGGSEIQIGDEIGLFTKSGVCAGAIVWDGGSEKIVFNANGDNSMTSDVVEGFVNGDTIHFKMYDKILDQEFDMNVTSEQGAIVYPGTYYVLNSLTATKKVTGISQVENEIIQNNLDLIVSPNPVNRNENGVDIITPSELSGQWSIKIFDAVNNLIDQAEITAHGGTTYSWDLHSFNGNRVTNGTYALVATFLDQSGESVTFKKMIGVKAE